MPNHVLSFDRHDVRSFPHFPWRRIDTWRYSIVDPAATDRDILRAMLADDHYAYSFMAPYPDQYSSRRNLRGPFLLDKLTPDSFSPITAEMAWRQLDDFLRDWDPPASRADLELDHLVGGTIDSADSLLQLQEDTSIRHEFSWIIGDWGEFVAVDRAAGLVLDIARGFD